jgi:uncharacterized membrane protein YtjA (UPF0391 family)
MHGNACFLCGLGCGARRSGADTSQPAKPADEPLPCRCDRARFTRSGRRVRQRTDRHRQSAQAQALFPLSTQEAQLLHYAIVFLGIALVAALLGFGGIAAGAAGIAKLLFFVFLALALVSAIAGLLYAL